MNDFKEKNTDNFDHYTLLDPIIFVVIKIHIHHWSTKTVTQ